MTHWTRHHTRRGGPHHRRAGPPTAPAHRYRTRRTAGSLATATRTAVGALTEPLPRRFSRAYLAWLAGRRAQPNPHCYALTPAEHAAILAALPG